MQPNYTNRKLKAWFRHLLRHPARKRSGSILNQHIPGPTQGSHRESSPSSFGRCGTAPDSHRPMDQANQLEPQVNL